MENALILSATERSTTVLSELLHALSCEQIATLSSGGEARRLLLEKDFDICLINTPLPDETGESLSRHIASKGTTQVLLLVKSEVYDEVSSAVEDVGVITLSKPLNRQILWNALKMAKASCVQMKRLQSENNRLVKRIEDIRLIDRAKCLLISYLGMSETEAHRYIEKQAMNRRTNKREVAEDVLKTYEN